MITLKLNEAQMDSNIRTLAGIYGRPLQQELRHQASLVLKDCVKMTPPMTFGKETTEGFPTQKKVGERAVNRDIRRVFNTVQDFDFLAGSEELVPSRGDKDRFRSQIHRLMVKGDYSTVEKMLKRTRVRFRGVVASATEAMHKEARQNSSGRVSRKFSPWIVRSMASIKRVINASLRKVGYAKSGFTKAATSLWVKLPSWITKQAGGGSFQEITGPNPSIYVSNNVSYIAGTNAENRIVDRALKNRLRNSTKEVEHAMAAHLRGKGVSVHQS